MTSTDLSVVNWFKSSHSSGQTDCVEVAWLEGTGSASVIRRTRSVRR